MGLMKYLRKDQKHPLSVETVGMLADNGRHILSNGEIARVLTDERLTTSDSVLVVRDRRGRAHILGGKK